ncbi:MAG: hypothetical protein PHV20_10635 [Bacteroidales bacterium]|nr:hypothetical protein [Bacteroidales bacterium]
MNKLLIISIVILLISCSQKKVEIYTPNSLSDSLENVISRSELDSLLDNSPYWKLVNFKTTNKKEQDALEILKEKLVLQKVDITKLFIYEIIDYNDTIVIFYLEHIDGLIYYHNLNKKNKELAKHPDKNGDFGTTPPATGNVTQTEGYYNVDIKNETLNINFTQ